METKVFLNTIILISEAEVHRATLASAGKGDGFVEVESPYPTEGLGQVDAVGKTCCILWTTRRSPSLIPQVRPHIA